MAWPKKRNGWQRKATKDRQRNKQPIGPAELEAELTKIRDVAPLPRHDRLYEFLTRVYRLAREAIKSPDLKKAILSKVRIHSRTPDNHAGYVIQAAVPHVNSKKRNEYMTALAYAYEKGVKPNDLKQFLKKTGGLDACCELWRKEYGNRAAS